ncbi:phosphoribosylanthranilate isomerase [Desulfobacterota bacterium AH_259_B03_O07]|nr:phosphoribosylanthranilate isomerase [Desulfobacterota bacterium AH_259_B03_O07]
MITYLSDAVDVSELSKFLGTNIVQLHGDIEESELAKLRRIDPYLTIIKSLIVQDDNLLELENTLKIMDPYVDAYITDTYDKKTGSIGATGRTHDWEISGSLVQVSNKPVILAGGLTPLNVYEGILKVRPSGVDVHTGVELKNGRKPSKLVKEFVLESKRAFNEIRSI